MTAKKAHSLRRVIDAAAQLATERGQSDVSIAEIAAIAHCSTATIYECFNSKEELLVEAFEHGQTIWRAPDATPTGDEDALATLFRYFRDRIEYLGSDRLRGLVSMLLTRRSNDVERLRRLFAGQDQLAPIIGLVEAAMGDGLVRRADPRPVAYALQASTSYEPLMVALLLDAAVDPPSLVRTVFSPLLTKRGERRLTAWLRAVGADELTAGRSDLLLGMHVSAPEQARAHHSAMRSSRMPSPEPYS